MSSVTNCVAILATTMLALALIDCGQQPLEVAPAGALPASQTAIGPIPGGGPAPPVRPNPYAGNATAATEGYKLFQWYNCSGCHGIHGGGGMGPSLRDPVWIYGGSPDQVFASISEGRSKGMPSWATKIPQDQIWKIVAYIETLRTPSEIDPPTMPLQQQQVYETETQQPQPAKITPPK